MRFALLRHEMPADSTVGSHWDLLLEQGDGLRAWRLSTLPETWLGPLAIDEAVAGPQTAALAIPLPPHRLDYLDYEGEVSGDRGTVRRCDGGSLRWLEDGPKRIVVELAGERLVGKATLAPTGQGNRGERWRLTWIGGTGTPPASGEGGEPA